MNWVCKLIMFLVLLYPVHISSSSVKILPLPDQINNENHSFVGVLLNLNGFTGSCFFVGDGEYVITARHMITESGTIFGNVTSIDNIKILAIQDDQTTAILDVVWMRVHEEYDLCIMKVKQKWHHSIALPSHIDTFSENDIFTGVGYGLDSTKPQTRPTVYDKRNTHRLIFQNRIRDPILSGIDTIPDGFYFDLSNPETYGKSNGAVDGEGIIGPGDSGGCAYIIYNNKKVAVGVFSLIIVGESSTGEVIELGFAVDLSSPLILEWLQEHLPNYSF